MAASMAGDREPVAALLKDDRAARTTFAAEREWAGMRAEAYMLGVTLQSEGDRPRRFRCT
jgi:hypothetical protein